MVDDNYLGRRATVVDVIHTVHQRDLSLRKRANAVHAPEPLMGGQARNDWRSGLAATWGKRVWWAGCPSRHQALHIARL